VYQERSFDLRDEHGVDDGQLPCEEGASYDEPSASERARKLRDGSSRFTRLVIGYPYRIDCGVLVDPADGVLDVLRTLVRRESAGHSR